MCCHRFTVGLRLVHSIFAQENIVMCQARLTETQQVAPINLQDMRQLNGETYIKTAQEAKINYLFLLYRHYCDCASVDSFHVLCDHVGGKFAFRGYAP